MAKMHSLQYTRKKLSKMHEQISISYHEAGHTVYGLLHFMNILMVRISESQDGNKFEGFAVYDTIFNHVAIEDEQLIDYQVTSEICMFYAGLGAEKHHFKTISGSDNFPMVLKNGSESDTYEASKLVKKLRYVNPGAERYAFKKKLMKNTIKTLDLHWDAVTAVAHALYKKKKLNFLELQKVLCNKTKNKDFWKSHFKKINHLHGLKEKLTEKDLKDFLINL